MGASIVDKTNNSAMPQQQSSEAVKLKGRRVPLDGTDDGMRSLPVAARLASALDADVVLVAAESPGSAEEPSKGWWHGVAATLGPRGARTEIVSSIEVADALRAIAVDEPHTT